MIEDTIKELGLSKNVELLMLDSIAHLRKAKEEGEALNDRYLELTPEEKAEADRVMGAITATAQLASALGVGASVILE